MYAASLESLQRYSEAADAYGRAVKIEPQNYDAFNNYGNVLRELGKLEESESALTKAIELKADHTQAHYNLGVTQRQMNKLSAAEKSFRSAIQYNPDFADAHNYLGNIYKARNQLDTAAESYRRALDIMPNYAEVHNNLGNVLFSLGNLDEAETRFRRALELRPDSVDVSINLGTLYFRKNQPDKAEVVFKEALSKDPKNAQLINNLATSMHQQGKFTEAEELFQRILTHDEQSVSVLHNFGNLALDMNKLEQGKELHQRVVEITPDSAYAQRNLGVTLATLGDAESAEQCYRQAIEIDPTQAETYYRLSEVKHFSNSDPDLAQINVQLNNTHEQSNELAYLCYAAGKAYIDIGEDTDLAFDYYARGAAAKRSTINYEVGVDQNLFKNIATSFDQDKISQIYEYGYNCSRPVFVVGMPRSGTTLMEHILASHSEVFGAGEQLTLQRLVKNKNEFKGNPFPGWIQNLGNDEYQQLGRDYWSSLREVSTEVHKVVDKMPNNFRFSGLILGMLNGARIIHVKRNSLDTCLSCFTHLFEDEQNYSYDLIELGKYYRAYSELMDHWKQVLPEDFYHEVNYEDIVNQPEQTIRTVLQHCGLQWESACLDFYRTKRLVPTASLVQVRQPLYKSAINRWKPFERQLQPLIDALGDLAAT